MKQNNNTSRYNTILYFLQLTLAKTVQTISITDQRTQFGFLKHNVFIILNNIREPIISIKIIYETILSYNTKHILFIDTHLINLKDSFTVNK